MQALCSMSCTCMSTRVHLPVPPIVCTQFCNKQFSNAHDHSMYMYMQITVERAAAVIGNLSTTDQFFSAIREAGAIQKLVKLLDHGPTSRTTEIAAKTLANLASESSNRKSIRLSGGVPPLMRLLMDRPSEQVSLMCHAWLAMHCAQGSAKVQHSTKQQLITAPWLCGTKQQLITVPWLCSTKQQHIAVHGYVAPKKQQVVIAHGHVAQSSSLWGMHHTAWIYHCAPSWALSTCMLHRYATSCFEANP